MDSPEPAMGIENTSMAPDTPQTAPTAPTAATTPPVSSPRDFMNTIQIREQSQQKTRIRAVLPSKVIWNGSPDTFEEYQDHIQGHSTQTGAGYLFLAEFQQAYLRDGVDCIHQFPYETRAQFLRDIMTLYGALQTSCRRGVAKALLREHHDTQDGLKAWIALVKKYKADGDPMVRIQKLEMTISVTYHRHFRGGSRRMGPVL